MEKKGSHARILDASNGTKLFPRYKKVFTTNTLINESLVDCMKLSREIVICCLNSQIRGSRYF